MVSASVALAVIEQMGFIVVINPNSTEAITRALDGELDGLRSTNGPEIVCATLAEGPPGIETDEHIREVEAPLVARVRAEDREAVAFVIACFSDPGLAAVRAATDKPVLGIARSGLMTALSLARKIGVISSFEAPVQRHETLYEDLGVTARVAGDRPVGMHVTELATHPQAPSRLARVGEALLSDGAGAIVLGCTGMTCYRAKLEESLGVPVIDLTVAAVDGPGGAGAWSRGRQVVASPFVRRSPIRAKMILSHPSPGLGSSRGCGGYRDQAIASYTHLR